MNALQAHQAEEVAKRAKATEEISNLKARLTDLQNARIKAMNDHAAELAANRKAQTETRFAIADQQDIINACCRALRQNEDGTPWKPRGKAGGE